MMKLFSVALSLVLLAAGLRAAEDEATQSARVDARRAGLDLAGAFSNDGFEIRDGHWEGSLEPKQSCLVQVNLYAGNEYWFVTAAAADTGKLVVTLFDEEGKPVETEPYEDAAGEGHGPRAAAGFAPEVSGPYYVRVELPEGKPCAFALLYCYK
jgi:hypothetical protein